MDNITMERSYALIGKYIHHWASLEFTIDEAIKIGLNLNTLQSCAIIPNIPLRKKLEILQVAIDFTPMKVAERKRFKSRIEKCDKYAKIRNSIVHSGFGLPEGDAILKLVAVRTVGGTLKFDTKNWTEHDFQTFYDLLNALIRELVQLKEKMKRSDSYKALTEATEGSQTNPFSHLIQNQDD